MQPRTGVLVVNLGSPDAPETAAVRRYLAEFLSDERVLDINPLGRWLLLHLIILRTRPAKSAEAYQKIWTPEGSPLLVHGRALVGALEPLLPDLELALAMRYGNPSIAAGLDALRARGCDRVVVFPLYPQYAASSTGTALEVVYRELAARWNTPYVSVVPPFFDDPGFIGAFAAVARPVLDDLAPDHVLLSFHGLPERHMRKSDESGRHCLASAGCCDALVDANRNCYRAQCFATARGLAAALGLTPENHTVCFQSRLGRTPWIQPYTDQVLADLPARGVRKLAVLCPAFTADCLETIEEIGMRAEADFKAAGGEELRLVPSLNAHPVWVEAAADLIRRCVPRSAP
ncbi:MAG: ferrochelatase [bacterium]